MYNYATSTFSPLGVRHAPFCCAISAKSAQIERHRKDLKEISASLPLTRLIEERDRVVAHLDRKLVNNPDGMFSSPPLDADKLRIAFLRLREILGIYDKQTSSLSLWIDESEDVIRELDYLIRLIDHDKEYKVD